jgi:polysaccharide deacetylase family protein (PEP-CTERM system associated)
VTNAAPPHRASPRDGIFLFSIDLEDVRSMIPDGQRYRERVPANTERILAFLEAHGARCTFFTVGDVARRYPDLLRRIAAAGHEIACHGSDHVPLDRLGQQGFRDDLRRALDDLARAGVSEVRGFRAPVGSLTSATPWAWEALAERGFSYSSSVIPARSPLYGWPGFGADCRRTAAGIWELPFSVGGAPGLRVPFLGGVYFRALPFALVRAGFRRTLRRGRPAIGYLHPYDVDEQQERFMHPELDDSRIYNRLMYWNRSQVLWRLERLLREGARVVPYRRFVAEVLEGAPVLDRPAASSAAPA